MDRADARRVIALAIPIGMAAEILLDGPAFGINVPIAIALVLSSAWFVRRRDRAPDRLDMWLPIAALVLSVLVAVRPIRSWPCWTLLRRSRLRAPRSPPSRASR